MPRPSLDEILIAANDLKRWTERQKQFAADLSDEVERIKAEDWQAPPDVEYAPEEPAPMDWALQEAFAKAKAKHGLIEEPQPDPGAWYTLSDEAADD